MTRLKDFIDYGLYRLLMPLLDLKNDGTFRRIYGDFRHDQNDSRITVRGLHSESSIILGCIAKFTTEMEPPLLCSCPG